MPEYWYMVVCAGVTCVYVCACMCRVFIMRMCSSETVGIYWQVHAWKGPQACPVDSARPHQGLAPAAWRCYETDENSGVSGCHAAHVYGFELPTKERILYSSENLKEWCHCLQGQVW